MNAGFWNTPQWRIRLWAALAALALIVMEATAVSLWYQALFEPPAARWGTVLLILLVISAASYGMLRAVEALRWRMLLRQGIFLAWMLLAAYASLKFLLYTNTDLSLLSIIALPFRFIVRAGDTPASFFHLVVILLLVWRGVSLARAPITLNGIQASFQLGLVIVLLYGMIFAPLHSSEAALGFYLFLFFGLVGMSLARIAGISELRGGRTPRFGAGWLAGVVLAGLLVVTLALLAGWLAGGRISELVVQAVIILFAVLTALVLFLLSPLLVLLAGLIPKLAALIEQVLARLQNLPFSQQVARLLEAINHGVEMIIPYVLATRGLILLAVVIAIFAAVLLALYLRKFHFRIQEEEQNDPAEPHVSSHFLQKLLQRMLRDARGLRLLGPARILAAARIRQIYRELIALSKKLGTPRPPSMTPLEFLPRLEDVFPGEQENLGLITGAYLKVRYGDYPETRDEVDAVQAAWNQVRRQRR